MKKVGVAVIVVLISSMCVIQFNLLGGYSNKKESEKLLGKAYTIIETSNKNVENNELVETNFVEDLSYVEETVDKEISKVSRVSKLSKYMIGEDGIVGILVIPKLKVEAPIREGTSQEIMKTAIGHFVESDYWEGNVSLASHNGGSNAHYFKNINKLKENDEIQYLTKLGMKTYVVKEVKKIKSTDWSMVVGKDNNILYDNDKNTITLITCINGQEDYRLCVRGIEK